MRLAIVLSVAGGTFVAGVAVGQAPKGVKFIERSEMKADDLGGLTMSNITGDYKKGAFTGLLTIPAGFTSPLHIHSGAYEAYQIEGTTRHWLEGEDGSKAKKMTPGSYWAMPGKLKHFSACDAGKTCTVLLVEKGKWDYKDMTPKDAAKPAGAGSAAGSAAKPAGAGSAAKPAGAGSAAKPAGAGSAAPKK